MTLSRSLVISVCVLGLAGCSSTTSNIGSSSPAAGPGISGVAPPPPAASSSITVAPAEMYNLGGRRPSAKAPDSAKSGKTTTVAKSAAKPEPKAAAEKTTAQASAPAETAAKSSAPAEDYMDDAGLLAAPVRKGSGEAKAEPSASAPQSSVAPKAGKSAEIMPVSLPAAEPKFDARFSS